MKINQLVDLKQEIWCHALGRELYPVTGDRDEKINHIISEFSKLVQKEYKTRHDWEGKVIHRDMCKKFKFDRTKKYTTQNPSKTMRLTKFSWILLYNQVAARRPDLVIVIDNNKKREKKKLEKKEKKKICRMVDFAVPATHRKQKER